MAVNGHDPAELGKDSLAILNQSRKILSGPELLHELVASPGDEHPAIEFLCADDSVCHVSYGEFSALSEALTEQLIAVSTIHRQSVIVPVVIPQSPELYLAWRAVLQAGLCVCPVSPDTPPARLRYIVEDVGSDIVLYHSSAAALIGSLARDIHRLEVSLKDLRGRGQYRHTNGYPKNGLQHIDPSSPAYVMYTSGSTGLPKGVQMSHFSACQSLLAHNEHIPAFKRFLQFASPTFDVSIFEIFFPFYRGATLVSRSREMMLSDLPGTIRLLEADAAELTPTVAGTLLRTRSAAPCLRVLLTIGEMLTKQVVEEFGGSKQKQSMLYAMYGPTEAAIHCTLAPMLSANASPRSIGRPLSTVTAIVLKKVEDVDGASWQIAALDEEGELAIAGQLADGYLNRPEQTTDAFVEIPRLGTVYRTGDRAICRPKGELEIFGRISAGQVKLRGQRVELGEVEEIAMRAVGVHQAVAVIDQDRLLLFCSVDEQVTRNDVSKQCKDWLPPFMRPNEIRLRHSQLPKLASGKLDRKALQAEAQNGAIPDNGSKDEGLSPEQEYVRSVCSKALRQNVSIDEDLWLAGLDSLNAIRLASELRPRFPSLTVGTILRSATAAEITRFSLDAATNGHMNVIDDALEDNDEWETMKAAALEQIDPAEHPHIEGMQPCTATQIGMLAESISQQCMNFNLIKLQLGQGLKFEQFVEAFSRLVARTPVLRSGFVSIDNAAAPFLQVIRRELYQGRPGLLYPLQISKDPENASVVNISIHHAMYDGWSWDLVMSDINVMLEGDTPCIRPQFSEISRALRIHASESQSRQSLAFWKQLLADRSNVPFPVLLASRIKGRSRSAVYKHLTTSHDILSTISSTLRTGRQTFIQACWALVLSAYTDSEDVTFGTVASGRHANIPGIEDVIGPCLTTLPTRLHLGRIQTLRDLLEYVQRQNLDSLKHYNTPLNVVTREAGLTTRDKLFDTIVVWQESAVSVEGTHVRVLSNEDALDYAVVVEVEFHDSVYTLKLTFDDSVINGAHAQIIASMLDQLMQQFVKAPELDIRHIWSKCSNTVMSAFNMWVNDYGSDIDLVKPIEAHALTKGQAIALRFVADFTPANGRVVLEEVSYADLWQRASALSSLLLSNYTINANELVCIMAPKSVELYVAILAAVSTGAGYMCIDPNTPHHRILRTLEEAQPALLLTSSSKPLGGVSCPQQNLKSLMKMPSRQLLRQPLIAPDSNDLAYAVFTSGTTGVPKGVLMTRRNLVSHIECLRSIYPHSRNDSLLQACSPAFDVSVFEIFWTWHMGLTLVSATNDVLFRDIEAFIRTLNVTHLSMTPSVAALVSPQKVPMVKMLVTAGEPMNSKVFHEWASHGLYQGYGPSETTNICNVRPLVQLEDAQNNVGPVFENTSVFVCKRLSGDRISVEVTITVEDFQLLPIGAVGEIWIGGEQVGRGYIDPKLTAHSFLDHPKYGWLYRSGDIGRILADGTLVVLGREDDQAKIRGQRIELGEISTVLLTDESIIDAVAVVDDVLGKSQLLAFVTSSNDLESFSKQSSQERLFNLAQERLPAYMVPDAIVPVESMPLTKQGKIDKKRLTADFHAMSNAEVVRYCRKGREESSDQLLSETELSVVRALARTVNVPVENIRSTTSFYALGLDSISAIRFGHNMRQEGMNQIDVSTILKNASVRALSKALPAKEHTLDSNGFEHWGYLMQKKDVKAARARLSGINISIEKVLPCTSLQTSMLAASGKVGNASYRNKLEFTITGDLRRLKSAWEEVMKRQQLLRTIFVPCDDADAPYLQVVISGAALPWYVTDNVRSKSVESPLQQWFKLSARTSGRNSRLTLEMHHALYDAEAMALLLGQIEAAYRAHATDSVTSFDAYLGYADRIDKIASDAFWHTQLQEAAPTRLAQLLKGCAKRQTSKATLATRASSIATAEIGEHVKQEAVTIQSFLQATIVRLLFRFLSITTVCMGTVYSGRNLPIDDAQNIIGPCFNTLPVTAQLERGATNSSLVQSLHNFNIHVLPFQPSSLRDLQRKHSSDGRPLFDVLLLLQQRDMELDDSIWQLDSEEGDMDFPFIFEVRTKDENEPLAITLHSNVAAEAVLEELLDHFDEMLTHTVRYPEASAASAILGTQPKWLRSATIPSSDATTNNADGEDNDGDELSEVEQVVKDAMLSLSRNPNSIVGRQTTIFKLGLDSINAVQLASKLRRVGYQITSSDILEEPTVQNIAISCLRGGASKLEDEPPNSRIDLTAFSDRHRSSIVETLGLTDADVVAIRPCTPLQCGILSQYIQSGGRLYYNTVRLKLHASVAAVDIQQAWSDAVQRYEMLRTGFAECDDTLCSFLMVTYTCEARQTSTVGGCRVSRDAQSFSHPPWHVSFNEQEHTVELNMLHALYDAQSLDVILSSVANALGERAHGVPTGLTSIDHTLTSILDAALSNEPEQFWASEHMLMQPTSFPDLRIHKAPAARHKVSQIPIAWSLTDISTACAELECTLQAVCQAAWARLLAAYTGQDRVSFGMILSGRTFGDDRDEGVFPCINTLPCTVSLAEDRHNLLHSLAIVNNRLSRNQHTPLPSIKRWQGIEEDAFNTVLVLQKYFSSLPEQAPWDIVEETANVEYDISIEIVPNETNNTLQARLTYSEEVLPEQASTIVLRQFEQLLFEVLEINTDHSLMESILEPVEPDLPTSVDLLHGFVERTVARVPESTALEYVTGFDNEIPNTQRWTYRELDSEGNRVANLLLSNGINPGDLVATCFDKCQQASFGILGVLKAGCAYVAIDPGAPTDRKNFILRDASCKIVLTMSSLAAEYDAIPEVLCISLDIDNTLNRMSTQPPVLARPACPDDTCYCLYTSGTTGTPKGCLISHRSAVQAMLSFRRIFAGHWNAESRWLQFASFHFDVSVLEQYWSWSVGIRVLTAPRDLMLEDLPTFLRQTRITHLDLTPSLARLISPAEVPSLCEGVFIVGGEQVGQDIIDTWGDSECLYNFYGPSEVTIGCTVHPRVKRGTKPTNIGQLWDNVGAYVLHPESEQPVLRGAMGELCLTGVLVGKGYLNRPELTEEKFATMANGVRMYRTGDLVRLLHDDSFEFLGRIDDQVKLRGQRLEIGEINQVIKSSIDSIFGVATVVTKHPKQGKEQLVAFFTIERPKRGVKVEVFRNKREEALVRTIREHCASKLPVYMVPSHFFMVSSLPLSANNKVDTKTLKTLYEQLNGDEISTQTDNRHSLSVKELDIFQVVAKLLSKRLSVPQASIHPESRLFELGLDSISAIGLSRGLRNEGFNQINIQTVMKSSLVIDLVHAASATTVAGDIQTLPDSERRIVNFANKHKASVAKAFGLLPSQVENISPCTPLQEGMIARVTSNDLSDTTYFAEFVMKLRQGTSMNGLKTTWRRVEQVVSILRTYFMPTEDGYAQVVLRANATDHGEVFGESRVSFKSWVQSARTFGACRPWRLVLNSHASGTTIRLHIFHGLYDGISLDLLFDKVVKIYSEVSGAETPSNFYELLPYGPLAMPLGAEAFWKQSLNHITRLRLAQVASDGDPRPDAVLQTSECTFDSFGQLCKELNVTMPAVFHAVWLVCLQQQYGFNPTIGLVVSGRTILHPEAETILGPMFNTIPCHISVDNPAGTFGHLIKACHKFNTNALPYQHTPLRQIAKWLGYESKNGLFDSLFVFQREHHDPQTHKVWDMTPAIGEPDYPINLEVEQRFNGDFGITLSCDPNYIDQEHCSGVIESYVSLLKRLESGEHLSLDVVFFKTNKKRMRTPEPGDETIVPENNGPDASWCEKHRMIRQVLSNMASLEIDSIGLHRPTLFEIGLDSIDAMKLATRLRNAGIKVPVSSIVKSPTVHGIALAAREDEDSISPSSSQDVLINQERYRELVDAQGYTTEEIELVLPVTAMQEGLLLEYEKYYNITTFTLSSVTDVSILEKAWNRTIEEQPILRSKFVSVDDRNADEAFLQVVLRRDNVVEAHHGRVDLATVIATMRNDAIEQGLESVSLRVVIIDSDTKVMVTAMPHAAYDGWSVQLMHQAVARNYMKLKEADRNPSAVGQSIVLHLDEVKKQTCGDKARDFWYRAVNNLLPSLFGNKDTGPADGPHLIHHTSATSSQSAQSLCRALGVTLQSVGLAVVSSYLARKLQQTNVCFGIVLSGRTTERSEELMLPTFNTVLFRVQMEASDTTEQLVRRAHASAMEVSEYQHFPLKEIMKMARTNIGTAQLFNTLFTYQKVPANDGNDLALYMENVKHEEVLNPPYAINIELEVKGDTLVWTLASQQGVFDIDQAEACLADIDAIFQKMVSKPDQPLFEQDEFATLATCQDLMQEDHYETSTPTQMDQERPWTEIELAVKDVLAEISLTEASMIGKATNLFHLGLDSISTIKVSSSLRQRGLRLPISKILEAQTVQGIAAAIEAFQRRDDQVSPATSSVAGSQGNEAYKTEMMDRVSNLGLDPKEIESILPSTAGQQYMLEMWQKSQGELFYSSFWFEMHSNISADTFRKAMDQLVEATPMLRTTFIRSRAVSASTSVSDRNRGEYIVQIVLTPSAARSRRHLLPWTLRIDGCKNLDGKLVAMLRIHHALYDAVSIAIVLEQLNRLCSGGPLASQNVELASYIGQTKILSTDAKARQRQFWTTYLDSKADIMSPAPNSSSRKTFIPRLEHLKNRFLPVTDLKARLRTEGVSLQAFFFAVIARVYHNYLLRQQTGNDTAIYKQEQQQQQQQEKVPSSVLLGIYLSLRNLDSNNNTPEDQDLARLAAPTVNIVPLRVKILAETKSGLWAAAKQVQRDLAVIGRAEHCGVSLEEVWRWSGGSRGRVGCVVNFLTGGVDENRVSAGDGGGGEGGGVERGERMVWHADEGIVKEMMQLDDSGAERGAIASPSPFALQEGELGVEGRLEGGRVDDDDGDNDGGLKEEEEEEMPWCIPTVDIEAKISSDGMYLGVGVFGQQELLGGQEGLERWFEGIGQVMTDVVGGHAMEDMGKGKGKT